MAETRIDELRRRLDRDPGSRLFAQLAEEHRKAGDHLEAIRVARAGLALHPAYPSARLTLGRALLDSGDPAGAKVELAEVLREAPDNILASRFLGQALEMSGDLGGAVRQYTATLKMAPGDRQLEAQVSALRLRAQSGGAVAPETTAPVRPASPTPVAGVAPRSSAGPPPPLPVRSAPATANPAAGPPPVRPGPSPARPPIPPPPPTDRMAAPAPASPVPTAPGPAIARPPGAPPSSPGRPLAPVPIDEEEAPTAPKAVAPGRSAPATTPPAVERAAADTPTAATGRFEPAAVPAPRPAQVALEAAAETLSPETPSRATPGPPAPSASAAPAAPLSSSTLAELYLRQGLTERAREVYRQVLADDPGNERARAGLRELEETTVLAASADPRSARRAALQRTIAALEVLLAAVRRD